MKIHLIGDIMIGRSFNDTFKYNKNFNIWGNTIDILAKSDLVIGNLETTLTDSNDLWPDKAFNFKLKYEYGDILKNANIGYLNIANNHILDYSESGMIDTMKKLDELHIKHTGAGINNINANKHINIILGDTKISIISFSDHYDYWAATENNGGINYINISDDDNINQVLVNLEKIKKECDILILSIHHGSNYVISIPEKTKLFFYKALKYVDIIHGHSAHHVLPIEKISNKYIFYSMGDFIDDYATDISFRGDLAFIAELSIVNKKISNLVIYPTKIVINYFNNILLPYVSIIDVNHKDYKIILEKTKYDVQIYKNKKYVVNERF